MKRTTIWTIILILLGFVLAGIFLTLAPDQIPVHYNIQGEVDRWGSKYEYLIMPFTNLVFGVFMALVARYEGKKGRDMNERVVGITNNLVLVMFNAMWAVFMWQAMDTEDIGGGLSGLTSRVILVLLMFSMIPMGNLMPKAQRNSVLGLRTKWSMANDHCWQQSQRVGGYIMVGTGFVGTILTALLPVAWGGVVVTALLVVMAVGCAWASYRIYMRSQVQ